MNQNGLEVTIELSERSGSMDALIVDLVPMLTTWASCGWCFDRDPAAPDNRMRLYIETGERSVSEPEVENLCFVALRRLASGAEIADSRLIALPTRETPKRGAQQVEVRKVRAGEPGKPTADESAGVEDAGDRGAWSPALGRLHLWSCQSALRVLSAALRGELNRKTLAPALVAAIVEPCRADAGGWSTALVADALANAGDSQGAVLRRAFEAQRAALTASGSLLHRRDLEAVAPFAEHLSLFQNGWQRARSGMAPTDGVLRDLILRHLVRLGFTLLEACYVVFLSTTEFSDGD